MIEKGNESKELAGQNQQEQIEEMSASEDVRDEMELEIEDKLKEYDTPFEVFFQYSRENCNCSGNHFNDTVLF